MSLMQSPADFLRPAPVAWHTLSIQKLQQEYVGSQIRPTDVIAHFLSRVDQLNPRLKAFIELDREGAWCAATISDRRFQQGEPRPLEGIPVAVAANIAVRGLEHSAGMDARRRIVAQMDSEIVTKLREAGAIILGTLNMDEAGTGQTGSNPFFGTCINPHDINRATGGAASGAATAVAAGMCMIAVANDTMGSLRVPAAFCGVAALKPTYGAVFDQGIVSVSARYDMAGPVARTLADIEAVSPILFDAPREFAMRDARLIRLSDPGATDCDIAVIDAYAASARLPEVMTLPFPLSRIHDAGEALAMRELIVSIVDLGEERCERLSDELIAAIEQSMSRSEADIAEDKRIVDAVARKLLSTLGDDGVLIMPTTPKTAFKRGEQAPPHSFDFTSIANLAGLPALTLPVGLDLQGLPIGLQLIGPARGEALVMREARKIDEQMLGCKQPTGFA